MNLDDIIRLAGEAGLWLDSEGNIAGGQLDSAPYFAALVAAAEREACAKLVDHILKESGGTYGDAIRARDNT
jgi:hypothetical protein